ncbi:MAG TPA: F0F1 ATP synthase subunit epsilon [Blastocatellia bacterium]|nr:F0F1 ATP synthase subunit epsilon [Blastocatellia bacterium]
MADTIQLEIVTPERMVLDTEVDSVQIPGLEGELGILPGHSPLFSQLKPAGLLSFNQKGATSQLVISGGFVQVMPDRVKLLAEAAERPEEIDLQRALKAKERAERQLAQSDSITEIRSAEEALERATTRIQIAAKK